MMPSLAGRAVGRSLRVLMARRQVLLRYDRDTPLVTDSPAGLVSPVPDILVDDKSAFTPGRRRRLVLRHRGRRVVVLARTCGAAGDSDGRESRRGPVAVDRFGRRVPLCTYDPDSRAIRPLVDLSRLAIVDKGGLDHPHDVVVDAIFDEAVTSLFESAGPPIIGQEVHDRMRALVAAGPAGHRALLEDERTRLERITSAAGTSPEFMRERILELTRLIDQLDAEPCPAASLSRLARSETRRLEKLVASRCCAALVVGVRRITGLLNPCIDERGHVQPLLGFRIDLNGGSRQPVLALRDPLAPEISKYRVPCPGLSGALYSRMLGAGDIYGLIDAAINFIETNAVAGLVHESGWPTLRRLRVAAQLL